MDIEKQREKHKEWVEQEGGVEHPTHIETLQKPEQVARLNWLAGHCYPSVNILDIGCNRGIVLAYILRGATENTSCGVDINEENIRQASHDYPHISWGVADVTKGLPFEDRKFATVVLADVLEHINWWTDVLVSLTEALRLCRHKLLITLPWRQNDDFALCFKHKWVPSAEKIGEIVIYLSQITRKVCVQCDGNFVYIEVLR